MRGDISNIEKFNVGIATLPLSNSGVIPLSNLISIIAPLSKKICLITGGSFYKRSKFNNVFISHFNPEQYNSILLKIFNYIYIQTYIAYKVIKLSKNVDFWLFHGGGGLLAPMIFSKLLRKKTCLALTASQPRCAIQQNPFLYHFLFFANKINYFYADRILLYSPNLIEDWNLSKYIDKIRFAQEHVVKFDNFKILIPYDKRENCVGYVGRFSNEKGIINFITAIPMVLEHLPDLNFLIVGGGPLHNEIQKYVKDYKIEKNVSIQGWVDHDQLPQILNKIRLLVMPSYTEGLPNIMIEAMACGTPILVSSVGSIPDIIEKENTGFILKDNLPESIASQIIECLKNQKIEIILDNAHHLVNEKFSYKHQFNNYYEILKGMEYTK